MAIARIRSLWTGPATVGGGLTDLYFQGSTGDEGQMAAAVGLFWTELAGGFASTNSVAVQPDVFNIDETTGDVLSIVSLASPPGPVTGTSSGDPLPVSTQGLIRWRTSAVVNNRVVRGRTFIPGPDEGANAGGRPTAGYRSFVQDAIDGLLAEPEANLMIWSRPTPTRPGSSHLVTAGECWSEWAVMRSRRD